MTDPQPVPSVDVHRLNAEGRPEPVNAAEFFGTGRSVLFAVPGAFTPGCSKTHLPGFVEQADELLAKGVDRIACIAVNDAWVMDAWGQEHGVGDKIAMLADGNGAFTKALGLEMDASGAGLGVRSKRYAAVIEDGVITRIDVDDQGGIEASACSAVIARL